MKRLLRKICVLVLFLMIPVSWVLIDDYVDRPFVDAIAPGVILGGFRLLETAISLAILFGLWKLMEKLDSAGARACEKTGTIERGRWLAQFEIGQKIADILCYGKNDHSPTAIGYYNELERLYRRICNERWESSRAAFVMNSDTLAELQRVKGHIDNLSSRLAGVSRQD
jgi:hypothetical protein